MGYCTGNPSYYRNVAALQRIMPISETYNESDNPTLSRDCILHRQDGAITLHRTNLTIFSHELQARPKVAHPALERGPRRRVQDSIQNRGAGP